MTSADPSTLQIEARTAAGVSVTLPERTHMRSRARNAREMVIQALLFLCAFSAVLITTGIIALLLYESWAVLRPGAFREFITGTKLTPDYADPPYGILPLLCGTLMITAVALAVALPGGTIAAIYLSEYAPHNVREVLKPVL